MGWDFFLCGSLDDLGTFCLCIQFSHSKVLTISEQDSGHGGDIRGGGDFTCFFFSWLLMLKLKWGLGAATGMLNFSWWLLVVAQLLYIFSGTYGEAWSGFSWKTFQNLWGFVKLSLASAVIIWCLLQYEKNVVFL
ncbi:DETOXIFICATION 29-like [Olea europaea subsp. europaea]|uniref:DETOXIFICATION 29-like n=1 Tax=Olea europaea subsp. europaea TaxID=158383 RepID=A0A8S0QJ13_OLEEU|nr:DETOXIFICATION 29-like [Olea europaea subsp. europaea]